MSETRENYRSQCARVQSDAQAARDRAMYGGARYQAERQLASCSCRALSTPELCETCKAALRYLGGPAGT